MGTSSSEELPWFLAKYVETVGIGGRRDRSKVCAVVDVAAVPVDRTDD